MLNGITYGIIVLLEIARVLTLAGITLFGVLPNWRLTREIIRRAVIEVFVQFMLLRLLVTFIKLMVRDVNEEGHVKGRLPFNPIPPNSSDCKLDIVAQLTASIGPVRLALELESVSETVPSSRILLKQVGKVTGAYEVVEF